jgi:hypothetical protein
MDIKYYQENKEKINELTRKYFELQKEKRSARKRNGI